MQTPDLPYRSSAFAHLCFLVSEALRGPRLPAAPANVAPATPRMTWLDRLDQWLWRRALREREEYLAQSVDLADLERRLRHLDRPEVSRYY